MLKNIINGVWFSYLNKKQQRLATLAVELYEREKTLDSKLTDYSFIIFPMAKAYEGFLKQYFHQMGLINQKTYEGRRFRIGRSLNPDVHPNRRDEYWLYGTVADRCGEEVARTLWETWLKCRNRIFHFYPTKENVLQLTDVGEYLGYMATAMQQAVECHLEREQSRNHSGKEQHGKKKKT